MRRRVISTFVFLAFVSALPAMAGGDAPDSVAQLVQGVVPVVSQVQQSQPTQTTDPRLNALMALVQAQAQANQNNSPKVSTEKKKKLPGQFADKTGGDGTSPVASGSEDAGQSGNGSSGSAKGSSLYNGFDGGDQLPGRPEVDQE